MAPLWHRLSSKALAWQEYVRQVVDLSPGQRKRYLGHVQLLARTPVRGSLIFAGPITAIGEAQLRTWLIEWDRSLKTKANYAETVEGEAVEAGAAVPDRNGVGDRRTAGQETWGRVGRDGWDGIAVW